MEYHYVGYTVDRKMVKGVVSAPDEKAAGEILDRWGYKVLQLHQIESFMPVWEKVFPSLFKVKKDVLIMFSRQLAMLMESGTDIVTALDLLQAQQSNRVFRRVINDIITDLRTGNRLLAAMSKYPDIFPKIYYLCLSVGEQAGSLETMLRQVSDYIEKEDNVKKSIKGALTYPILVSVVAIAVVILLVTFVIPAFTGLYAQLGAELPLATKMLLDISNFLRAYGIYLLALVGAAVIAAVFYFRTPNGKYEKDKLSLRLPLLGSITQMRELSYCCRTLAVLYKAGLPLTEAMDVVIEGAGNAIVAEALADVRKAMVKGEGLSLPMMRHQVFLPMMVQMVRVGEETGSLDSSLMTVAETYESESSNRMHALIGILQPAITAAIGLVVGFVAIAMLSAMYSIYGSMK